MPDMHEYSANLTGGIPVLGGLNQVHESRLLLPNIMIYQSGARIQTYKPNIFGLEATRSYAECQFISFQIVKKEDKCLGLPVEADVGEIWVLFVGESQPAASKSHI